MSKNKMLMQEVLKAVAMAALVAVALPELGFAASGGDNFGASTGDFMSNQLGKVPKLISALCFVGGIIMMTSGALKLKAHAENATQTPIHHGVTRLLVGGSIAALPVLTKWVSNSTSISTDALSANTSWNASPF